MGRQYTIYCFSSSCSYWFWLLGYERASKYFIFAFHKDNQGSIINCRPVGLGHVVWQSVCMSIDESKKEKKKKKKISDLDNSCCPIILRKKNYKIFYLVFFLLLSRKLAAAVVLSARAVHIESHLFLTSILFSQLHQHINNWQS